MFTREEYPKRLQEIGLTKEQTEKLQLVLEEMMMSAARNGNRVKYSTSSNGPFVSYMEGKSAGINAVYRFLGGEMDAHDEFEDEE